MFWLVLIVGIVVLIGSCKNDDDATTSTLSAPTGTSATLGWHQVAVDWTAVSGASSYTVYWGTSTGISSSSTAITGITDDNSLLSSTAVAHEEQPPDPQPILIFC